MVRHRPSAEAGCEERRQDELKGAPWHMQRFHNEIVPYHPGDLIQRPLSAMPSSPSVPERLAVLEVRQTYTDRRMDRLEMELRQRRTSFGERLKWAGAFILVSMALGARVWPEIAINLVATVGGPR